LEELDILEDRLVRREERPPLLEDEKASPGHREDDDDVSQKEFPKKGKPRGATVHDCATPFLKESADPRTQGGVGMLNAIWFIPSSIMAFDKDTGDFTESQTSKARTPLRTFSKTAMTKI
jgi:hypothetical protein